MTKDDPTAKLILVPLDFEGSPDALIAQARDYAEKLGARLLLVHVHRPPDLAYPEFPLAMVTSVVEDLDRLAEQTLREHANRAHADHALRFGDPATEILKLIREKKPALVVMGTHGRRGLKRLVLGSVAEEVIRHSDVPVLTVRSHVTPREPGTREAGRGER